MPSTGGEFDTQITGTVGRGIGQISTFNVNVPAGRSDLGVTLTTPDASADNPMTLFLVNPAGTSVATHTTTTGNPPRTRTVNGVPLTGGSVTFHVPNPMAGTWEIDVELNLTTSGKEFTQTVVGDVLPQAPAITSPADGASSASRNPLISGTGTPGDTVTVSAGGAVVCTATVGADGSWSCTPSPALPAGPVTLTATQADATGNPSAASAMITITEPLTSTSTPGTVAGTAPATLSLSLGAPASFGAFTPGIDKTYAASTTANVISSAGDAALSVSPPGHLTNGAFSLTDPLQVSLSKSSWSAPVSNDPVTLGFTQHVGASEALRTGSYSQTLTFTLSTTQP